MNEIVQFSVPGNNPPVTYEDFDPETDSNPYEGPQRTPLEMFGSGSVPPVLRKIRLTKMSSADGRTLSKIIRHDPQTGGLNKQTQGVLYDGAFQTIELEPTAGIFMQQVLDIIRSVKPNECLTLGRHHLGEVSGRILSQSLVSEGGQGTMRGEDAFCYTDGEPALGLFDYDPADGAAPLDLEGYEALLRSVEPAIINADLLLIGSTGSGIYHDGRRLDKSGGIHGYIGFTDAKDIPGFGRSLFARLVDAGYGWIKISESGGMLLRSPIDVSVFQGSRQVFECAEVQPPLTQQRTHQIFDSEKGVLLDASRLQQLTEIEFKAWQASSKVVAALKADPATVAEAARVKAIHRAEQEPKLAARLVEMGVPGDEAAARAKAAYDGQVGNKLPLDWPIYLMDGRIVLVREILVRPNDFHGMKCRDPLEPGYSGGRQTAVIYSGGFGVKQAFPQIYSKAHGLDISYPLTDMPAKPAALPTAAMAAPRPFAELMNAAQEMLSFGVGVDGVAFLRSMGPILDDLARGAYDPAEVDVVVNTLKEAAKGKVKIGTIRGELARRQQVIADAERAARRASASPEALRREQILAGLKQNADGNIASNISNALTYIQADSRWDGALAYDEFAHNIVVRKLLPWPRDSEHAAWTDADTTHLHIWLQQNCAGLESIGRLTIEPLPAHIARMNAFHPVRDYLRSQKWDGHPRLDGFTGNYLGIAPEDAMQALYLRAVGARFFIGAVARVMQPGCKRDETLIIESFAQGFLKSTLLKIIATRDEWFSDSALEIGSKDGMQVLRGVWIYEMPELDALSRKDAKTAKSFLASSEDRYRPPFGRHVERFKRQCVLAGSTNEEEYFRDQSGNRRFWPIRIHQAVDLDLVRRDIHQLWAEAFHRYSQGEQWHLTAEEEVAARREQDDRLPHDEMTADVLAAARRIKQRMDVDYVTVAQLIIEMQMSQIMIGNASFKARIGHILKRAKFVYSRPRNSLDNGERPRVYIYPSSWAANIIPMMAVS